MDGVPQIYNYDGYQLDSVTGTDIDLSFLRDDVGRVTGIDRAGTDNDLNLSYDAFDQLKSITDASGSPILEAEHDVVGRRTQLDGDSDKDVLVASTGGDYESPLLATSADDFAVWSFAGDMPLMRMTADGPVYYLSDAGGSIIGLADNAGGIGLANYDSFGNIIEQSGLLSNQPAFLDGDFGFQGGWLDPDTGLVQFRSRTYDPVTGLFLSRDHGDVIESEIESFSPYQFTYHNPHVYSDPSGNFTIGGISVSMSISGNMRAAKGAAIQKVRQEVTQELKEFVVDQIFDQITSLIGGNIFGAVFGQNNILAKGRKFENIVTQQVCNIMGNPSWIHLQCHSMVLVVQLEMAKGAQSERMALLREVGQSVILFLGYQIRPKVETIQTGSWAILS